MRVAIAAAGSGGHVFPALAVAAALRTSGMAADDIIFFGGDRMEATTIPAAGYPFIEVEIHGIRRRVTLDNLRIPNLVRRARRVMIERIRTMEIGAMAVFGGYIAGPAALAARATGIPLIVHEANAVPGVANRMVARSASAVLTSFSPAGEALPGAEVIGSPLRSAFTEFDRSVVGPAARARYGVPADAAVLGILGGSLGAAFLNDVGRRLAADSGRDYSIIHLTGRIHGDEMAAASADIDGWVTVPFEDDMVAFYAAADLVLSRGGAMTVSELQATATPAVIVPLPAGKGYQARNAEDLEASGGGIVVEQSTLSLVAATVASIMDDPLRLERMRAAESSVDHRAAAHTMARRILELADA